MGAALVAVASAAVLVYVLWQVGSYSVTVIMWIAVNALAAVSLRFVMLVGELNIATAAFYGMGAYMAAMCTVWWELPLVVTLLASGLLAAVASAGFGYVTLRTKGPYFLLVSFAFTEVIRLVYTKTEAIGGNSGMIGIFPSVALEPYYPAVMVAVVMALILGMYLLERSTLGTVFRAIQNNDAVVQSVGINILVVKIACVVIASFCAGVGGALHAHANNVISPGDFSFLVTVFALAYVKIGGERHVMGPVLGAIFLTVLGQYVLTFGALEAIFFGAALVIAMLVLPEGLLGLFDAAMRRLLPAAAARKESTT
jgi:branched-chain amino acid transport system permease protein